MKKLLASLITITATALTALPGNAEIDNDLTQEAKESLTRGGEFLLQRQEDNGSWLHQPAITALACIALHEAPHLRERQDVMDAVMEGRDFILANVREDGAIAAEKEKHVNYTTSLSLIALAVLDQPDDRDVILDARQFLIDMQLDEDHPDHPTDDDNPFYGGIGYGSAGPEKPDISNTQWALEAIYMTRDFAKDTEQSREEELAWGKALNFLEAVQNVPEDADSTWVVSDREEDHMDGGFIYKPDESKVNEKLREQGIEAEGLRSYGSMTYAGLKSMIYAELDKNDYRVEAAVDWARKHYTLDENPVMGPEGHFYYLQTFAKAMDAYGAETIDTADEGERNWREDLIRKLLKFQKEDGQWQNDKSGRWMESIPDLVTAYAMIAMEVALEDVDFSAGEEIGR